MLFFRKPATAILTVCTANICRSPMAEGLLREELAARGLRRNIAVASAGTRVTRPGLPADGRAVTVCAREGIDIRRARARQVEPRDFARFDYILAMDETNLEWLQEACPQELRSRISLLGSWAPGGEVGGIADPYYGSQAGFELVLAQLHQSVDGFLAQLLATGPGDR